MTVRRKLFLTMAAVIAAMALLYAGLTLFVVKGTLEQIRVADRSPEIGELTALLTDYYTRNGRSWDGVGEADAVKLYMARHPQFSLVLQSQAGETLLQTGSARYGEIRVLGLRAPVELNGERLAKLFLHDPEAANLSKIQYGISSSVTVLLLGACLVIVPAALLAAYWLARRLTRPLSRLVTAIEALGRGEFGVQADAAPRDEYGTVGRAFNAMSHSLRRAEDNRRKLTADVAHELRTPITIVRGKLELLQQNGRPALPEQLLPLQDELIRLTRLVDDLHRLSLAEAGRLTLDRKPTDIAALLRQVARRLADDAEAKALRLSLDDGGAALPAPAVDSHRMAQVFLNLLTNAVRYTPAGGEVVVRTAPETGEGGRIVWLRVEIANTGPGIDPSHLPRLFDRFYRTDDARDRNQGGMGLGLAIAKEFTEAHGGTIAADSAPGQGARFTVRLPV